MDFIEIRDAMVQYFLSDIRILYVRTWLRRARLFRELELDPEPDEELLDPEEEEEDPEEEDPPVEVEELGGEELGGEELGGEELGGEDEELGGEPVVGGAM